MRRLRMPMTMWRKNMNNKHTTDFAMILSGYLFEYLPIQIGVSENTYKSYYDTIRLFLDYCTKEHNLKRHKLKISDINKDIVISFYDWIESERECSPSTRNQRRAGINSFFKYVQYKKPEYMFLCQQILSIPVRVTISQSHRWLKIAVCGFSFFSKMPSAPCQPLIFKISGSDGDLPFA